MLTITLLGTAATMPLPERALTAAVAECGGHSLLLDCGEGTQTAARRAGVNLMRADAICLTHYHGDHIFGLPGLLQTLGAQGLNISDNFLNSKEDVFKELVPDDISNLERYVKINNEVRISNEKTLLEIGKNTSPTMLWSGAFKRLPGSASRASFGDQRTYMHNGTKIDEQTHMGQDLASRRTSDVK